MKAISLFAATAQAVALKSHYVPSSDVYIQFLDNVATVPEESENLQLEWHAPPSIYDEYDAETGEIKMKVEDGDVLIPAEQMDKFWIPNNFFPV